MRRHFSNERSKQLSDTLEAVQRDALGSMGSLFASNDVDAGVRSVWNSDDCSLIPAFATRRLVRRPSAITSALESDRRKGRSGHWLSTVALRDGRYRTSGRRWQPRLPDGLHP